MSNRLYIFSDKKQEYFYINQAVRDTTTGQEGKIIKLSCEGFSTEVCITVKYAHMRRGYFPNQQIGLEKINQNE